MGFYKPKSPNAVRLCEQADRIRATVSGSEDLSSGTIATAHALADSYEDRARVADKAAKKAARKL